MDVRAAVWGWGRALMLLLGLAASAQAQPEAPTRVGRIAAVQGELLRFDAQADQWLAVARNQPVLPGDRLAVAAGGSAELQIGASTLRLGGGTEVEAARLDDQRLQFALARGSLALRLDPAEAAAQVEVITGPVRWQALRDGLYRIDQHGELASGSNWRGLLRATTPDIVLTVEPGQRLELPAGAGNAAARWSQPVDDALAAAFLRESELAGSTPDAVSAQITGVADLARHGTWQQHPQFGWVWTPLGMAPNWAPYRQGQWVWQQPWGWTWVDAAPWGFAPYHYGRWFPWGNRWFWAPGPVQPRPVRPRHLGPPPPGLPPGVLPLPGALPPGALPPGRVPPPMVPGPGFDPRRPAAPMPPPAMPPPSGWLHRHDAPPGLQGDAWLHRAAPLPGRPVAPPRERTPPRPSVAVDSGVASPAPTVPAPVPSARPAHPTGPFGGRPVGAQPSTPSPEPAQRGDGRERRPARVPAPG